MRPRFPGYIEFQSRGSELIRDGLRRADRRAPACSTASTRSGARRFPLELSCDTARIADSDVRFTIDGHVATIVLDRPAKLNAVTPAMADEVVEALPSLRRAIPRSARSC